MNKCYHQACDTLANLNTQAMDQFADNAANATARLVMRENDLSDNTQSLKAKRIKKSQDFKGPQLVR